MFEDIVVVFLQRMQAYICHVGPYLWDSIKVISYLHHKFAQSEPDNPLT